MHGPQHMLLSTLMTARERVAWALSGRRGSLWLRPLHSERTGLTWGARGPEETRHSPTVLRPRREGHRGLVGA